LSTISHHYIFRFYVDRVDTFKRINVELQTSKLNKIGSNIIVCTPSTMIRCSQVTLTSELLCQSHKVANLVSLNLDIHLHKTTQLICVFTPKQLPEGSYQGFKTILSRSKGKKHFILASKFVTKLPKSKTIDLIVKPA